MNTTEEYNERATEQGRKVSEMPSGTFNPDKGLFYYVDNNGNSTKIQARDVVESIVARAVSQGGVSGVSLNSNTFDYDQMTQVVLPENNAITITLEKDSIVFTKNYIWKNSAWQVAIESMYVNDSNVNIVHYPTIHIPSTGGANVNQWLNPGLYGYSLPKDTEIRIKTSANTFGDPNGGIAYIIPYSQKPTNYGSNQFLNFEKGFNLYVREPFGSETRLRPFSFITPYDCEITTNYYQPSNGGVPIIDGYSNPFTPTVEDRLGNKYFRHSVKRNSNVYLNWYSAACWIVPYVNSEPNPENTVISRKGMNAKEVYEEIQSKNFDNIKVDGTVANRFGIYVSNDSDGVTLDGNWNLVNSTFYESHKEEHFNYYSIYLPTKTNVVKHINITPLWDSTEFPNRGMFTGSRMWNFHQIDYSPEPNYVFVLKLPSYSYTTSEALKLKDIKFNLQVINLTMF